MHNIKGARVLINTALKRKVLLEIAVGGERALQEVQKISGKALWGEGAPCLVNTATNPLQLHCNFIG